MIELFKDWADACNLVTAAPEIRLHDNCNDNNSVTAVTDVAEPNQQDPTESAGQDQARPSGDHCNNTVTQVTAVTGLESRDILSNRTGGEAVTRVTDSVPKLEAGQVAEVLSWPRPTQKRFVDALDLHLEQGRELPTAEVLAYADVKAWESEQETEGRHLHEHQA